MDDGNNLVWKRVERRLREWSGHRELFKYGQDRSLAWMAERIGEHGFVIADEVGLGKTRLALLALFAALEEGGNVAAVVPPGLLYQWQAEAKDVLLSLEKAGISVNRWRPILIRSYSDLFKVLHPGEEYPLADQSQGRWVLLSQAFDFHVRGASRAWRVELPTLVKARWARRDNHHGNSKFIQYARTRGIDERERLENEDAWLWWENAAADFLAASGNDLEGAGKFYDAALWDNPALCPDYRDGSGAAGKECIRLFQKGQPGRRLLLHLVGRIVGDLDLLVVDEAHKSRHEGDAPAQRLPILLEQTLLASRARRISMTATPIELGAEQWISLLQRTGLGSRPEWRKMEDAVRSFASSHSQALSTPSQPPALDALIRDAGRLQQALAPYVTRRRRIFQEEMSNLLPPGQDGAHPHRATGTCPIAIPSLTPSWRKRVLAMEGLGLAAKGLAHLGHAARHADIRYASGLECAEEMDAPEEDFPAAMDREGRKQARYRAWRELFRKERAHDRRESEARLWDHPRVRCAVDRIETLLGYPEGPIRAGIFPPEKVLVFGIYTRPMESLRDVLNARFLLRAMDQDQLAFIPDKPEAELLRFCYLDWREKRRFTGVLATHEEKTPAELVRLAAALHKRYESARDALQEKLNVESDEWMRRQPGDGALRRMKLQDIEVLQGIFDLLRAEIFDGFLQEGRDAGQISREEIESRAHDYWVEHLRCILHGKEEMKEEDEEEEVGQAYRTPFEPMHPALVDLDAQADRIPAWLFKEYLYHEPRSRFSRLMNGSVKQETRRSIQAGFNRQGAPPFVLIAQSMVGREGLNLHRACRRVFLFNPEWNPGVTEQQIGRVDRIESLWTRMAMDWAASGRSRPFPRIEVETLVFQGTYDEYRAQVLRSRRAGMNAQLFGELLDEEALSRVPLEYRDRLQNAAPNWEPPMRQDIA